MLVLDASVLLTAAATETGLALLDDDNLVGPRCCGRRPGLPSMYRYGED